MKLISNILMLIAFACGLVAYNLWTYLGKDSFYIFIAVEFLILYSVFWIENKNRSWKLVVQAIVLICLNSLIDEIWFNPSQFETNEYISAVIIILATYLQYRYGGKRRKFRRKA